MSFESLNWEGVCCRRFSSLDDVALRTEQSFFQLVLLFFSGYWNVADHYVLTKVLNFVLIVQRLQLLLTLVSGLEPVGFDLELVTVLSLSLI